MITRKEYMANSSELHHEYYSQFVTEATKQFVLTRIGMDKLLASTDGHLNDTAEMTSRGWIWDSSPVHTKAIEEAGEWKSQTTRTCVGKAAARILLEEYKG